MSCLPFLVCAWYAHLSVSITFIAVVLFYFVITITDIDFVTCHDVIIIIM